MRTNTSKKIEYKGKQHWLQMRLLVISNRLPVTVTQLPGDEGYSYHLSSGGLVSALSGLQKVKDFTWIGWPGIQIDDHSMQMQVSEELLSKFSCIPVFLDNSVADLHYNGFSNR